MQQAQIDRLRSAAIPAQQLFVGGRAVPALGEARIDVVSPIDGRLLTTIADGNAGDIDRAVKRARD
ncbi:aldehyde dehydrogenase, partial [Escherichia coli]|nr:aldehyde dehydrogenase [Escherichia coli]